MHRNPTSEYILGARKKYALYTNNGRYIPNATDGLKRAMRQAMEVMYTYNGKIKTSALSGAMQEKNLYPHGDASDSINSLAAPYLNNLPLLRGHGNFGTKINPTAFSASRYTEVDKAPYLSDIFYVDRNIIPLKDNFDGSRKEPKTFLPLVPLLLVNGMVGIGTGWATTILPRKFEDVCQAVIDIINGKTPSDILPNYSWEKTKCEFIEYNDKGNSRWLFKGTVKILDAQTVEVIELPSDMSIENFKERLATMEDEGNINDFIDSSSNEISITIKLKRGTCKGWTEEDAIDYFNLKKTRTENFVVVGFDGNSIVTYSYDGKTDPIIQYLKDWVEWRFSWYVKRYEDLKKTADDEIQFLKLLFECYSQGLPSMLGGLKDKEDLRNKIKTIGSKACIVTCDEHIERICNRPTYSWTRDGSLKVMNEIQSLEKDVKEYVSLISDEKKRKNVYVDEVKNIKDSTDKIMKSIEVIRGIKKVKK